MHRIKPVKNIFQKFSFYKSTFTIVHINGKKSKAGFPFIVKPAASDDRLGGFIVAEPVHDQQEYKSPPSVICLQKHRDSQQCQYADKLHIPYVIFLGEDEVAAGTVSLKDLRSGEQITVPAADAAERILADIELRGQGTILK
mgnify:CR=1 FL=1